MGKKGKKLWFTTDAPEFKKGLSLDIVLDKLKEKYNISKFSIEVHTHPGKIKDKDIYFDIPANINAEEIKSFILEEFYSK